MAIYNDLVEMLYKLLARHPRVTFELDGMLNTKQLPCRLTNTLQITTTWMKRVGKESNEKLIRAKGLYWSLMYICVYVYMYIYMHQFVSLDFQRRSSLGTCIHSAQPRRCLVLILAS